MRLSSLPAAGSSPPERGSALPALAGSALGRGAWPTALLLIGRRRTRPAADATHIAGGAAPTARVPGSGPGGIAAGGSASVQ